MTEAPLAGIGVLVTRPEHQADALVSAIEQSGGSAIRFPTLQISARDATEVSTDAAALADPDICVFVSPNAVQFGIQHAGSAHIAVVGPATAAAIEAAGKSVDIHNENGFDSEHLLQANELQDVAGKIVRIVRGQDGRELLAETLRKRGAIVEHLAVYARELPGYAQDSIDLIGSKWRSGDIDVVTAMSIASFDNLVTLLPVATRELLEKTPLVTPAARVLQEALNQFPTLSVTLAETPGADEIVSAIVATRGASGKSARG